MNPTTVGNPAEKPFILAHQNVCITSIDLVRKYIKGFVELLFVPVKLKLSRVRLNAKQCEIIRLLVKGSTEYYPCTFTYNDPLLEVVPSEPQIEGDVPVVPERTLKKFSSKHQDAVFSTEIDFGNGEIIIHLPEEVQKEISDGSTFKVFVEYAIDQPKGGLHFVTPKEDDATGEIDLEELAKSTLTNSTGTTATTATTTTTSTSTTTLTTSTTTATPATTSTATTTTPATATATTATNASTISTAKDDSPNEQESLGEDNKQIMNGVAEGKDSPSQSPEINSKKQEDPQPQQIPPSPKAKKSVYAHLFTYKNHNSSRLWFPCLDSFAHPCTWLLEFTVESHLTVVSCGDLVGTYSTPDRKYKTFKFELNVPTAAPNIGFVAGQFETWIDSASAAANSPSIKNYYLTGLKDKLAKSSCAFLTECAEFYEDFLLFKYPYSNYKQVFVDQAYENYQSYATLSICCTNLLHSSHIIDQVYITRSALSEALASQYFNCFIAMSSWSAAWLTRGISTYIAAQYRRKVFGNNEYRYNVQDTMKQVIEYEQKFGGVVLDETSEVVNKSRNTFHFSTQSSHTISPFFDEVHRLKSFLVIRMLEDRIGKMLLIQVFNKILSLAAIASQQPASMKQWSNMLLSTTNFEKAVFTVTGKDKEIASFIEHWIYQGGHAKFNGSFVFDRKRNVVELQIRQPDTSSVGIRPYFGPITVTVQELDGTFPQKLNIEENKTTPFVITCHSKSRRNKKKKIPLCTGEEVDMDLSMMENHDSPVLWIRIDPDMQILRQIVFEQPDYNWQYQLKYERDITAQMDSLQVLNNYPTVATRKTLTDIIEDERCYYRVRCKAALNLTKIANDMAITTTSGGWQAPTSMINIYKRLFGSYSCPHIIRLNQFSVTNLQSYFLQKTIPKALAGLRVPPHRICPPEVLRFLLDLFKYNDNSKNSFSDTYYKAALIEALAETVTPVAVPLFNNASQPTTIDQLPSETRLVAEEIVRYLNLEKILPGYKYVVTCSCLRAIQQLQRMGHLPSFPSLFRSYTAPNVFIDVRCAAVVELVDIIRAEQSYEDLSFLLDLVEKDQVPAFKFFILAQLHHNPPLNIQSFPNCAQIRERLWAMLNSSFANDSKLRCAAADVYHRMFGKPDRSSTMNYGGDSNHKSKKKKKKKDKDKDREKKKSKKSKESLNMFLPVRDLAVNDR